MSAKTVITELLALADIEVNGTRDWDIQVHNEKFYARVLSQGSLGLGEAYMDGWWDCKKLDEAVFKTIRAKLEDKVSKRKLVLPYIKANIMNMQSKRRSKQVAEQHYNIGTDFYTDMLGDTMQYTCAYWKDVKTLKEAQEAKMELICKKLQLKKGEKVLDLGCGWGGLSRYMAEKYDCEVTGYNIAADQVKRGNELSKGMNVQLIEDDYRNAQGMYDKIVSIGLCEHVGYKNYKLLMQVAARCLKEDGLFLLHTIGGNDSAKIIRLWINKYIFPGAVIPSVKQLSAAAENIFVIEDFHNFGVYYDPTLMAWYENHNKHWDKHKDLGERFKKMWDFYLLSCAGIFRAREIQLWQIVLSKGMINGYTSIR